MCVYHTTYAALSARNIIVVIIRVSLKRSYLLTEGETPASLLESFREGRGSSSMGRGEGGEERGEKGENSSRFEMISWWEVSDSVVKDNREESLVFTREQVGKRRFDDSATRILSSIQLRHWLYLPLSVSAILTSLCQKRKMFINRMHRSLSTIDHTKIVMLYI